MVVDRLVVKPDLGNRLPDSIETALRLADGIMFAENATTGEDLVFFVEIRLPGQRFYD